MSHSENGKKFI